MLDPGQALPNFTVVDQVGAVRTKNDLLGAWTVLFWFPAAFTPG